MPVPDPPVPDPDEERGDPANDVPANDVPANDVPEKPADLPPGEPRPAGSENPASAPVPAAALQTSWLHPTSLIFELGSHFKQLLIPAGIAILSAARGSRTGLFFAVAFFVPAVIYSVFRYFTLRYRIDQGELVVKQGLVFRRVRTVPVSRIQNIDLVQNVLHRLFHVAEVRIETASGTEAEATLRVLSMQKIAELREEVFRHDRSRATPVAEAGGGDGEIGEADEGVSWRGRTDPGLTLLEISREWLVKAGLASNRGMLIIGILAGTLYQFEIEEHINLQELRQWAPAFDGSLGSALVIAGLTLAVLVLLRLLGVIWFFLRFSGYRLSLHGEDLRITCGLLTRVSATVPRKRIQFISIHRPLVMRWFRLAAIRIETAGGGGSQGHDNASTTVSRRWFVPVMPETRVSGLLGFLRPGLEWNELALDWKPLSLKTGSRLKRLALIQALVVAGIGIAVTRPWGWAAGVLALPFLLWWAGKKSRAMRYARTGNLLVYRSGVLNRKTSVTFFDKVQVVDVSQSPFDRRWKMATLSVDTAAAGSAEHRVRVRYLDEGFAASEYLSIAGKASTCQPDFG